MLKITRLYNRNRRLVWSFIIIAIFCIAIINLVNGVVQEQSKKDFKKIMETIEQSEERKSPSEKVDYDEAAKSIASGISVNFEVRDEIQGTLEQFIQYVCNNEIENAYELLTEECKKIKYSSVDDFRQNYCQDIKNKTYTFQSWSSSNRIYVYQVKFFEDMLSSGLDTTKNYLQDYITVINKDGEYKINISNLIKFERLNKMAEYNNIKFQVNSVETYLDNEIYEIEITNSSLKEIILDTRKEDNSTYVKNSDGLKIRSLLYENKEEDLKIQAGESKIIRVNFNNTYNGDKYITCIGFSDIIIDQEQYQQDSEKGKLEIEVYLQ